MISETEKELLSYYMDDVEHVEWVTYSEWVCAGSEDVQDLLSKYKVIWLHEYPGRLYLTNKG